MVLTIYITPGRVPGRFIIVGRSGMVPGHIDMVVVPGYVPGHCVIAAMVRGISKNNLVGSDEEIREDDRVGGGIDTVSISFRYIYPADLSIVIVASTNFPEVSEVIEAMGN